MVRMDSIEEAFLECEDICRRASSTFYASFSALPFKKRRAVHAVYALCRYLDDIADGDSHPVVQESEELHKLVEERDLLLKNIHQTSMNNSEEEHRYRLMALVDAKVRLTRLFEGDETAAQGEPIFIAMNEVFKQFPVRLTDFETIIEGMEDDLFEVRHKTWDEVRAYCYKVASAVGLVLIEIYGCDDAGARIHAIDMGIQLQMINILRDVSEDYRSGRIYLPINVLSEYNIEISELGNTEFGTNHRWKSFVQEYIEIVRRHQESAQHLFEYLDSKSQLQPQLMCEAYDAIFHEIVRRSGDVFSKRPSLSTWRKIRLAAKLSLRRLRARWS
ncbi:MAG: phytoene/squalene synthase family protein [Candidatus Poseidoniaceae archaeon]